MNHSGSITSDETWYLTDSPHIVTGYVTIGNSAKLTIEAGCMVKFDSGTYINVGNYTNGSIEAIGTLGNEILFTSNQVSPAKDDYPEVFNGASTGATVDSLTFRYCIIEYGTYGIRMSLSNYSLLDVEISDCIFRYIGNTACDKIGAVNSWFEDINYYAIAGVKEGATISGNICYNASQDDLTAVIAPGIVTCTIENNLLFNSSKQATGIATSVEYSGAIITVKNNTIYNFDVGISGHGYVGDAVLRNNIIVACNKGIKRSFLLDVTSTYNCLYDNITNYDGTILDKTGDILVDPKIINLGGTTENDYRLESQYGRWNGTSWVTDAEDSLCIDTGDPSDDYSNEPIFNGGRINMGFDGNTQYASKSELLNLELYDIDNDFRTMKTEAYNIDNDFRLSGTESILDIDNDFRLSGASLVNVDNDFRMSINLEKIDINDDFRMVELNTPNINNKISTSKVLADDISNKCSFLREKIIDVNNIVSFYISPLNNINNDIRTKSIVKSNINNDFRMLTEWIEPGDPGFQSFGHTYIKVYIGGNEQTDIKIDSIIISKILNGSHTATFDLARPYDDTKPSIDSSVEIKYREWTLYKGYVTDIVPTNSPESIRILCNDKHWQRNKVNKYFFVGHEPKDNTEKYYEHINEGLSECGFDFGIGDFIPQTINCFGIGESDCITSLVINSGNFAWYYDVNENKQLWKAGKGSIINLERQELDKNLHLHQVLRHQFRDSIINIINKFKVQMGDKIIKRFNRYGGSKEYAGYHYKWLTIYPAPMWDDDYEKLTKDSETGYGFDYHKPEDDDKYVNVFKKYKFWMFRNYEREDWTDRYPPQVTISKPFWGEWEAVPAFPKPEAWDLFPSKSNTIREGFTIDYDEGTLTFNTPHYFIRRNSRGEEIQRRKANVSLSLFKKKYWSRTEEPTDNPEEDITSPLMFFTDKMGDYPETIIDSLELSGLSIQEGGLHITGQEAYETLEWSPSQWKYITVTKYRNIWTDIPSWDDTEFARDYANWQLSKICDKKITGSIDVTLDTAVFYGINLSKRIMINGVMEIPLNIVSISYNIGNFTTTINLENPRNYRRSVSLQSRGEGE